MKNKRLEYTEFTRRNGSVSIGEYRKEIQVCLRFFPLKEGWEIRRFDKTPAGRIAALECFEAWKQEIHD